MSRVSNKIHARDRTVRDILQGRKYTVDYFQREYTWKKEHIQQLVTDLTASFMVAYQAGDERSQGANYNNYYLGSFVLSEEGDKHSIIDGQQRLTSLTLLLIYLSHRLRELDFDEDVRDLIRSKSRGKESFNIQVEGRKKCLTGLLNEERYEIKEGDDESTVNMVERYRDIAEAFPDELLEGDKILHFIDWLTDNVILVEIVAYSNDNAYTIFETMNDRGLNLTATEMLKSYLLSRFTDTDRRQQADDRWRKRIQDLRSYDKDDKDRDQQFFQAWLRGQYAVTIRPSKKGSKNEDFEIIGTRFHHWVRNNLDKMELSRDCPEDFEKFLGEDFKFFVNTYSKVLAAEKQLTPGLEHVYYASCWGIASSLSHPLYLASLTRRNRPEEIIQKISIVARYLETFAVRRAINFRGFSASSIRFTMCTLAKDIRRKGADELREILKGKLIEMDEGWDGMDGFRLHGQNRRFVRFLLARITAYIQQEAGHSLDFTDYHSNKNKEGKKPFEIEHIWADKFEDHQDEFSQQDEFSEYRNRIGGLVLLRRGTNQSFGAKPYEEKRDHYLREENLLVQSLCKGAYDNNPNFTNMYRKLDLNFKPYDHFTKDSLDERQQLYRAIAERIWSDDL